MAFCPECGKAVTPDEATCAGCGKQLRSADKKARAGRFHGTMMMTAPEVPREPPANLNAQTPSAQAQALAAGAAPATWKATMIGAALAPARHSQPPGVVSSRSNASEAARAKPSSSTLASAEVLADSERPPLVLRTSPHASQSPSVRAVQSVPVSPSADGKRAARPAGSPHIHHDAQTIPSPLPQRGERASPNPARVVQAIPEVDAAVVAPHELPSSLRAAPRPYLPGDPMAPQPPRAARAREHPFAPENPEVEGHGNYILLYWAVCVAVVAAACALAFRWL